MISTAWLLIGRNESERMSRLIDADMTRNWITEDWFLDVLLSCVSKSVMKDCLLNVIDSIPLAYDVDNVVEQLGTVEELREARTKQTQKVIKGINMMTKESAYYCKCCGQKLDWRDMKGKK